MKTKIKKVEKRDGRIVDFDQSRITRAILAAGEATGEFNLQTAKKISDDVVSTLQEMFKKRKATPKVEEIQDVVEIALMKEGYTKTAKAYILYRQERQKVREERNKILNGKTTNLPLSLNSLKIMAGRYLLKDRKTDTILETPEEMFQRVARAIAEVEKKYQKSSKQTKEWGKRFYEVMTNFEFTPAGRTLANAGASTSVVSNCIVLHIEDSMDGIYSTLRDATLLQQAGSGVGFPFHTLRPAGSLAKRTQGVASGPVSFLRVYNEAFGVVKQQGRHGANMAVMRVDHPDILDFIHAKNIEGELKNFNISVSLTDEFLKKVESNSKEPWMCRFGGKKMLPRIITRDKDGIVSKIQEIEISPSEIIEEIISAAWANGEPGVIFIDEVNRTNPLPGLGKIEACNPCGEQMLHDGDVCNLGSINLDRFVKNKKINWERLKEVTILATRMLDNVVDLTNFPIERVNKVFRKNRRIGLGIMGFADMLFQLEIPYNSEAGYKTAKKIMKFITDQSHLASQELAKEKGVFPNYNLSVWKKKGIKMRNAAVTNIAPTGTISMVCDVSSGLEPYFALSYMKGQVMGNQQFFYTNRYLEEKLREEGIYSEELINKISQTGSIQDLKEIPEKIRKVFVGALDIAPKDHIKMQAAFQKYTDNSISKTINLPNKATVLDVQKSILLGWKSKLKAFTVYREGSRKTQVLSVSKEKEEKKKLNIPPGAENNNHYREDPIMKCEKCQG